ncbi:hypothetical protein CAMRE0001_1975 [Campylobacter rectus RM3267]|uniref:Uncharacterized protein n=1 Tax=Campylobacter rectus RM3267 TaxID=553218 RepID=B9CYY3_CAMRE|nr:hypothetical protein CAMRE0001_1975 [Campylobacter rectus RM3267]
MAPSAPPRKNENILSIYKQTLNIIADFNVTVAQLVRALVS